MTLKARVPHEPGAVFVGKRPRCAHCGRRVARSARSAILHADGTTPRRR